MTALTWAGLRTFHQSLDIGDPGPQIALAIEILLGAAALAVPAFGVRAVARSLRARRLARDGHALDARTAAEDSRDDVLFVIGLGLVAAIVSAGAFFLSGNQASVRSVLFNWDLMWRGRSALWRGFWWNVRLFVVAEAIVLVLSLIHI